MIEIAALSYIERARIAQLFDGFAPSLATIADPAVTRLAVALANEEQRAQAVQVLDPKVGWVVIPPGPPN